MEWQDKARVLVDEAREAYDNAAQSLSRQDAYRLEHEALGKILEAVEAMLEYE